MVIMIPISRLGVCVQPRLPAGLCRGLYTRRDVVSRQSIQAHHLQLASVARTLKKKKIQNSVKQQKDGILVPPNRHE